MSVFWSASQNTINIATVHHSLLTDIWICFVSETRHYDQAETSRFIWSVELFLPDIVFHMFPDQLVGPVLISVLLFVAILVNFIIRCKY